MNRLSIHYLAEPERDRWIPGDRYVRPFVRRVLRGRPHPGGLGKVVLNLCAGLELLGVPFDFNRPYHELDDDAWVVVLGRGRQALAGYRRDVPLVAGIGLMTHPSEWPSLLEEYPVALYLQHSTWTAAVYRRYFGDRCAVWPVGIDTRAWSPSDGARDIDLLIYDKIHWNRSEMIRGLVEPIRGALELRGLRTEVIRYGYYRENDYKRLLSRSRAMLFLCEHESQGLAYLECLSAGVPVLAWDQGWCLDPQRFFWRDTEIPATSVPYFDDRCGSRFRGLSDFERTLDDFLLRLRSGGYDPRSFVLQSLTLETCARRFLDLVKGALGGS